MVHNVEGSPSDTGREVKGYVTLSNVLNGEGHSNRREKDEHNHCVQGRLPPFGAWRKKPGTDRSIRRLRDPEAGVDLKWAAGS